MTEIDNEIVLFQQETDEILDFSGEILTQLPPTDATRTLLITEIQNFTELITNKFTQKLSILIDSPHFTIPQITAFRTSYSAQIWDFVNVKLAPVLQENYTSQIVKIDSFESNLNQFTTEINNFKTDLNTKKQLKITPPPPKSPHDLINSYDEKLIQNCIICDKLIANFNIKQPNLSISTKKVIPATTSNKQSTLKQTITEINEIWTAKAKSDLKSKQQGRSLTSIRQFLVEFFTQKLGPIALKTSQKPQIFARSVQVYSSENFICGVFQAEIQGFVDEFFKFEVSRCEERIRAKIVQNGIKMGVYGAGNGVKLTRKQLGGISSEFDFLDVAESCFTECETVEIGVFLNQFGLKKLKLHMQKLMKFSSMFKKYDSMNLQRLSKGRFMEFMNEFNSEIDGEKVFQKASFGHRDVVFSQIVVVLGEFLFGEYEAPCVEIGLKFGDL